MIVERPGGVGLVLEVLRSLGGFGSPLFSQTLEIRDLSVHEFPLIDRFQYGCDLLDDTRRSWCERRIDLGQLQRNRHLTLPWDIARSTTTATKPTADRGACCRPSRTPEDPTRYPTENGKKTTQEIGAWLDRHIECRLLTHPQELHENLEPALRLDIRLTSLLLAYSEGLTRQSTVCSPSGLRQHPKRPCGLIAKIVEVAECFAPENRVGAPEPSALLIGQTEVLLKLRSCPRQHGLQGRQTDI